MTLVMQVPVPWGDAAAQLPEPFVQVAAEADFEWSLEAQWEEGGLACRGWTRDEQAVVALPSPGEQAWTLVAQRRDALPALVADLTGLWRGSGQSSAAPCEWRLTIQEPVSDTQALERVLVVSDDGSSLWLRTAEAGDRAEPVSASELWALLAVVLCDGPDEADGELVAAAAVQESMVLPWLTDVDDSARPSPAPLWLRRTVRELGAAESLLSLCVADAEGEWTTHFAGTGEGVLRVEVDPAGMHRFSRGKTGAAAVAAGLLCPAAGTGGGSATGPRMVVRPETLARALTALQEGRPEEARRLLRAEVRSEELTEVVMLLLHPTPRTVRVLALAVGSHESVEGDLVEWIDAGDRGLWRTEPHVLEDGSSAVALVPTASEELRAALDDLLAQSGWMGDLHGVSR